MEHIADTLIRLYALVTVADRRDERGDVPGWVMITVMTVAIVGGIWAVADEQLTSMLKAALSSVSKG
ncbi:MAG: hypothetical protein ACR2JD_09550 [Nocardioides sp.]